MTAEWEWEGEMDEKTRRATDLVIYNKISLNHLSAKGSLSPPLCF